MEPVQPPNVLVFTLVPWLSRDGLRQRVISSCGLHQLCAVLISLMSTAASSKCSDGASLFAQTSFSAGPAGSMDVALARHSAGLRLTIGPQIGHAATSKDCGSSRAAEMAERWSLQ